MGRRERLDRRHGTGLRGGMGSITMTVAAGIILLVACTERPAAFTADDEAAVRSLEEAYRTGWLSGDSAGVMATLGSDAVLIPDGSAPVEGDEAIRAYWWPQDGSETVIESYEIQVDEVDGSGDLAYLRGRGSLTFTYRPPEGAESRIESESVHLSIARREADGRWRITRRAWITRQ